MQLTTKVLLLLTLIFIISLAVVLWGGDTALAAKRIIATIPNAQGELTIVATDYDFTPNVVRVKAGQQLKLTIRNDGLHTHEFMVGKQVHLENGVTEPPTPDFFEGLQVEVTGSGMPMGFAGMEEMEMDMEMDMSGDDGMDMEMGEGAKVVLEGAHVEPMEMGQGDHHGGMVMVNPAQESTIIMTIPEDKVGVWTFGCFREDGLHFDDGMRGILIVEG